MTARRTHVIGAGIAGLSAALTASEQNGDVILYEAAPHVGGRCRTILPAEKFAHDNGTHVLFTANRHAFSFLKAVGARHRWIEPEPGGLPVYDPRTGTARRVGLSPWSWLWPSRRPQGLEFSDLARILRLVLSSQDAPVASLIGERPIMESLIEPLTVAILNTSAATASSQRLAFALRQMLRPGAARLMVARNGLSEDLIQPALDTLRARGVRVLTGQRLRALLLNGERAIGLTLTDRTVALGPDDQVILALPPYEIERLLPVLAVPQHFEPILNVHYRLRGLGRPRFIGMTGALAQWVLVRQTHASVTVSAAQAVIDKDADILAARIWREIAPALQRLGIDASVDRQPEARVVKEKRATIRQAAVPLPQPPVLPLPNLTLAGDWIGSLPATIESAIASGKAAALLLRETQVARFPAARTHPAKRENAA